VLDHVSIQCADVTVSSAFYDAVLPALGGGRVMDFGSVIGYGTGGRPSFWLGPVASGADNRELHIAFRADDRDKVRRFCEAARRTGAEILHEPRLWPEYHSDYYGAFVRDPDGNNVEAVCHAPEKPRQADHGEV
jgi:catechol 2,3-dioxygenase-like lactoylglutathione lyase family enzyme